MYFSFEVCVLRDTCKPRGSKTKQNTDTYMYLKHSNL